MMRMKKMRSEAGKEGIMRKTKDSKRCCSFVLFIVKRKKMLVDYLFSLQDVCDDKNHKKKIYENQCGL